jgi:CDP-paratose 2-epimerase
MTVQLSLREHQVVRPLESDAHFTKPVLITGGAGFIGSNLAARLLAAGRRVVVFDNISRPGVRRNVVWLRDRFGASFELEVSDVRDRDAVFAAVHGAGAVFHLAAQVAVTTSLNDPVEDFCVNALGTLNVLEAIRAQNDPPPLVFTSTNKVYGELTDLELEIAGSRYQPRERGFAETGVSEDSPLEFHSPYGCSKGAADQYVRDYARSYGLPTVVLRMSCIYGPRQFGTEDQGWLAHFLVRALNDEPIVIFGDGRQVRDALYVDDLVDALLLAERHARRVAGEAFNIGGGPANTTSLLELLERIGRLNGRDVRVIRDGWRAGDQRYFVSDTRRFQRATGWQPRVDLETGLARLHEWLVESKRGTESRFGDRRAVSRPAFSTGVAGVAAGHAS